MTAIAGLRSLHNWLTRQAARVWLPRTVDPIAELKYVCLGEYGVMPIQFNNSAPRHGRYARPTWRF